MKERLNTAFWFFLENGPSLFTVAFTIYVVAIAQTESLPTDVLLQWILTILGLLAISELIERLRKIRRIEQTNSEILEIVKDGLTKKVNAEDFFVKNLPALSEFGDITEIWLCGVALQGKITQNIEYLSTQLRNEAKIKIILVNPNAIQVVSMPEFSIEYLLEKSKLSLENINWLLEIDNGKGNIELRLSEEQPQFTFVAINPNSQSQSGSIMVEFFPQRWRSGARPRFILSQENDNLWYEYFKDQFEKYWNSYAPKKIAKG